MKFSPFLAAIGAVFLVTVSASSDSDSSGSDRSENYCSERYQKLCKGKGTHVACQYPEPGPGLSCENYTRIGFTNETIHLIISYINRRRQKVAAGRETLRRGAILPQPRLMMMVEWDPELASLAQRLADQCLFAHDSCRATVRYPYAGQTVGEVRWRNEMGSNSAHTAIRRVLAAWWGEKRRADASHLLSPFNSKGVQWGDFTQLALAGLTAVGCGAIIHKTPPRLFLVCDYSHTNMLGQSTLTAGRVKSCPPQTARRPLSPYPLLCAMVRPATLDQIEMIPRYDEEIEQYDSLMYHGETKPRDKTGHKVHVTTHKIEATYAPVSRRLDRLRNNEDQSPIRNNPNDRQRIMSDRHQESSQGFEPVDSFSQDNVDFSLHEQSAHQVRVMGPEGFQQHIHPEIIGHNEEGESAIDRGLWAFQSGQKPAQVEVTQKDIYYRPTKPDDGDNQEFRIWKQTRYRPRRPGEIAMLHTSTKRYRVSLMIDKDDIEQVFQDTGFKIEHHRRV